MKQRLGNSTPYGMVCLLNMDVLGRLVYKESTGELLWKGSGKRAGYYNKTLGYWMFFDRKEKMYYQHRLIWETRNGPIPDGMYIDHIDRDRTNNRLDNLRLLSPSESCVNRSDESNSSGHRWVGWDASRSKWRVQIKSAEGPRVMKRFEHLEDAVEFANKKAKELHGDLYYDNRV